MPTAADHARIAVLPDGVRTYLADAVEAGGGVLSGPGDAVALVWAETAAAEPLGRVLDDHAGLRWVQLPWAGVEPYVDVIRAHPDRTWTCGKGVYAEPVAEHALALALAGLRGLGRYARAMSWTGQRGHNLLGARVTIVGGGGIAESLLRLLVPFGCDVTVVRRNPRAMAGATRVLGDDQLDDALTGAELVVLALPLMPGTVGLIDRRRLELLAPDACLVNIARGQHVVTPDLVEALGDGTLGSAGLDVTDPEPLPDGHPLWTEPRALITPHVANPDVTLMQDLARLAGDQVRRLVAGEPLLSPVDPDAGY
jgi:phosphoglycerate dehydrogenase-like enzyme